MRFHQPYTLMRLPSRARGNELRMLVRVEISDQEPPATGPIGRALNVLRAARCSSETAGSLCGWRRGDVVGFELVECMRFD